MKYVKSKEKSVSGQLVIPAAKVGGSVRDDLVRFCLSLGGKVERMRFWDEFGCTVNPEKVIERFSEFKRLYREAKGSDIGRIYFGEHDKYFFAYPREGEAGFMLTYEIEPPFPKTLEGEEESIKFLREVKSEFYGFMDERGLPPEFGFIPRVEAEYDWLDVEARVLADIPEEFDGLPRIAKAMLEFDGKVKEIMRKYGRIN